MTTALLALLLLALAGSGEGTDAAPTHVIAIDRMAFASIDAPLRPGDVIEWRNEDAVPHTVTAADGSFDLVLAPGERGRSVVASSSGRIEVLCRYHPGMTTTLLVTQ